MSGVPEYWHRAATILAERDPVMQGLVSRFPGLALASRGDAFSTLARSIVGQQISVKAAQSVWDRVCANLDGQLAPATLEDAGPERLRACGLSASKVRYLLDLAQHFRDGRCDPDSWTGLDDETLVTELTRVKGIGRWTAEMFLIFHMVRPDVLPLADVGLQRAMSLHYNSGRSVSPTKMQRIARIWAPWRSVATWYLWRSLDPVPVEY